MATIPMSSKTALGVGRGIIERTNDDHKGKDVNPIFLDETLLWFGRDDLAFGRKRWG
jgi:hypothetical protein